MAPSHLSKLLSFPVLLLLLFFSFFHVKCYASTTTITPFEEAKALVEWKNSLSGGGAHSHLTSWVLPSSSNYSSHCDTWNGISCNSVGRIVELGANGKGLKGSLQNFPFSFLDNLVIFDLSVNSLYGTIPSSLSNLRNLTVLYLYDNQLSGNIPLELGNLKSLVDLELGTNQFTGPIPSSLGNLQNLTTLYLYENQLSGPIPSELGNLISLVDLELSTNYFTGPISSFVGNLQNLTILYLYENHFSGPIPLELGNLKFLVDLDLSTNNITGLIPSFIGNLENLTALHIDENQLSGPIPLELGNLKSLVDLSLSENQLSGPIPLELGNLISLTGLSLFGNNLIGPLPQEITKLKLFRLSVSDNKLSGPLPKLLCSGGVLQHFTANSNNFIGPIPMSLKNCKNLFRLRLDGNKLSGEILDVFGTYPKLNYIDLSNNNFNGELPNNWSVFKNLTSFRASNNNITGRIPKELASLEKLGNLDISMNHLVGEIPRQLGSLPSLFILNLSGNNLDGYLPKELGRLSSLESLDLSTNNLSGRIPKEIGDCVTLGNLNLSRNMLTGLPKELGRLSSLESLDLSTNNLSGRIPKEIGDCVSLENLNLSRNMLTGSIPHSFENMTSLISIDVSYNQLEGPVPESGAFKYASTYFEPNKGVCGNIAVLRRCEYSNMDNSGTNRRSKIMNIFLGSVGGASSLLLMILGIYFLCCKKKRGTEVQTIELINKDLFHIGDFNGKNVYEDIIEATEGFDIKHCIGARGSRSFYKTILSTGQVVAVKKFHTSGEQIDLKLFSTEIHALTELRHRSIVKLYAFCSHFQHSFLVYEYLEKGSLSNVLSNVVEAASLDWMKRIHIVKNVASALSHMHHACTPPLIHRDISSKNILLNSEYEACVADFGIASVLCPNSSIWTVPSGTYGYLPPEVAHSTLRFTEKCDVYSFGVLTLEVLMGKHPGEFITSFATSSSAGQTNILLVDMLDKRLPLPIPDILKEVVLVAKLAFACLNTSPESRPTMDSVSHELSSCRLSFLELFPMITVKQLLENV